MITISVKKGYKLSIEGVPSSESEELAKPASVAVLPERIPFIKPRLLVQTGDRVKIGSVLFEDKRNPDIKFLSPGGGEIADIRFGPRRVIKEIVIRTDDEEASEEFEVIPENDLKNIEREKLIKTILDGGLWPLIRGFPFRDIAAPDDIPPAIFVSLGASEPFQPDPEVWLKGKKELFEYGIHILQRLGQKVHVCVSRDSPFVLKEFKSLITHIYKGVYPADDPGVLLYHTKKEPLENQSWYVSAQDVLLLAQLLKTGKYPIERTVVLAGSSATEKKHIRTRLGVPLGHLADASPENNGTRYVVGGIFRGYTASESSHMGFYETSLTLLPEGKEKEMFGFIRPGFRKPSYSRTFLSSLNPSALAMDCNLRGDVRACINCGSCAKVCPVDILPQFTMKCVLADEVEEALEHGLLDCVECGLCTYVCPSKIELCTTLKDAKAAYYIEK
ncbi:Na(+)-translocating NADH-quinone reductase subunit A [Desulfonema magnum]|uniref:Na(+)-translocating NADH-quinone reductase subunit A n=1 Tax=Desulfonema magnum TaxID=45655 RepID=A0A975GQG3_9BACT|nr:Na(+)-translocating NADH-quinone reductase subunit A [Desulfonema magnum]QTA89864.1 Na(+)-translocating NADH-quinone reductase, subunit A [Desulfonema magnum]